MPFPRPKYNQQPKTEQKTINQKICRFQGTKQSKTPHNQPNTEVSHQPSIILHGGHLHVDEVEHVVGKGGHVVPVRVLLGLEVLSPEVLHPLDNLSFDPAQVSRVKPRDGIRELFDPALDGFRRFQAVSDSFRRFQTVSNGLRRLETVSTRFYKKIEKRQIRFATRTSDGFRRLPANSSSNITVPVDLGVVVLQPLDRLQDIANVAVRHAVLATHQGQKQVL